MEVNFRQLEQFVAVAELGSFTRAAVRLHVVQSGVSATVAGLERELAVTLLVRTTRSVTLTDAGRTLLGSAREILDSVERAEAAVSEVAGGMRGTLRVGIMHSLLTPSVAHALAHLHRRRPHLGLRPQTSKEGASGLVHAVAANELDIAFAAAMPSLSAQVDLTVISSERMVLVCPPGHRLASRGEVQLSELLDEPFVEVPEGWGSRASVDGMFTTLDLSRRVEIEVGDVATVLDLVRVGLGIALIAPSSATNFEGLHVIRPGPAPMFDVHLVLPSNRPVKPAARELADMVIGHLEPPGPS